MSPAFYFIVQLPLRRTLQLLKLYAKAALYFGITGRPCFIIYNSQCEEGEVSDHEWAGNAVKLAFHCAPHRT